MTTLSPYQKRRGIPIAKMPADVNKFCVIRTGQVYLTCRQPVDKAGGDYYAVLESHPSTLTRMSTLTHIEVLEVSSAKQTGRSKTLDTANWIRDLRPPSVRLNGEALAEREKAFDETDSMAVSLALEEGRESANPVLSSNAFRLKLLREAAYDSGTRASGINFMTFQVPDLMEAIADLIKKETQK